MVLKFTALLIFEEKDNNYLSAAQIVSKMIKKLEMMDPT